jgi:hypothetical protein
MRRNMDLIRNLMLKLEAAPMQMGDNVQIAPGYPQISGIEGTDGEINYHLELIRDEGLLNCPKGQPMFGIMFTGLTWKGHDFVDSMRDEKIW